MQCTLVCTFFFFFKQVSEVGESSPTVIVPGLGVSIGGDTRMKNRSDLIHTCAWLLYLNWILCVICDQGRIISGKKKIRSELTWKKAKLKKIGWNINISLKKVDVFVCVTFQTKVWICWLLVKEWIYENKDEIKVIF